MTVPVGKRAVIEYWMHTAENNGNTSASQLSGNLVRARSRSSDGADPDEIRINAFRVDFVHALVDDANVRDSAS